MSKYKKQILELRQNGKTYNEICAILDCSKAVVAYHCARHNLGETRTIKFSAEEIDAYYQNHTLDETAVYFNISRSSAKKYTNNKRIKLSKEELKVNNVRAVQKRRQILKEKAVAYKGGKCECCDYDKYVGALEFHHKDPEAKSFGISHSGFTRSWKALRKELDKCLLVCSNCHKEIHAGLIKTKEGDVR